MSEVREAVLKEVRRDMFCPKCGAPIEDENTTFCTSCGARIGDRMESDGEFEEEAPADRYPDEYADEYSNEYADEYSDKYPDGYDDEYSDEYADEYEDEFADGESQNPKRKRRMIILIIIVAAAVCVIILLMWNHSRNTATAVKGANAETNLGEKDVLETDDSESEDETSGQYTPTDQGSSADQSSSPGQSQSAAAGTYILPESDSRYYSTSELSGLSKDQLRLARNEIYARHGRKFDAADLQSYFDSQPWYKGTIESSAFNDNVLNQYEKTNIATIQQLENGSSNTAAVSGSVGTSGGSTANTDDSAFEASWNEIRNYGFGLDDWMTPVGDYYSNEYDYSPLSFWLQGGTAVDNGDYYTVQAVFEKPVMVPADMKAGDTYTAVVDELTGEKETFTCVSDENGAKTFTSEHHPECGTTGWEKDGMVALHENSEDRIDAPFYNGVLRIRKDALTGDAITQDPYTTVTMSDFAWDHWFNAVAFDGNGYVTQLIFVGD